MTDATIERKKRAINVTVDAALLDEAKQHGTNVSAVLETALRKELTERRWHHSA